jgi:nucleotide-binding universal stress UspA family protein
LALLAIKKAKNMGPVLLALSSFRLSQKAIETAFSEAAKVNSIIISFIVDVNLHRYLLTSDLMATTELEHEYEQEMLDDYKEKGEKLVKDLEAIAQEAGLTYKSYFAIGRFGLINEEIAKKEQPSLIVTTRTNRPQWVKLLFGSPVSYLISRVSCKVIEV